MDFKTKLKQLRIKAGLTQKALGIIIGVTGSTISSWENGIFKPKIRHLIPLSKCLNVSADYLLGLTD